MVNTNLLEGRVVLEKVNSKVNGELAVVRDLSYGVYIHGGGLPQSGGLAEMIWKSSLNKIRSTKFEIRNCLIVGLGGGSIAKLVRRNWPEARITGVDIDQVIVDLGKKYMGLDKHDVEIIIADAEEAIKNPKYKILNTKYDLVCFDTYVQANFPEKFEKAEFIKAVKNLLSENGVAVFNRLFGPNDRDSAVGFEKILLTVFSKVDRYYPEANIMFACIR